MAVLRNKTRLNAEFTKIRIKKGYATLEDFRNDVEIGSSSVKDKKNRENRTTENSIPHPRWVRINKLKANQQDCFSIFSDYKPVDSLSQVIDASQEDLVLFVDDTVPDLVALSPGHDLRRWTSYETGKVIIQDKASCFPAMLLRDAALEGDIIDACAAPGNKTTHIAGLICQKNDAGKREGHSVFAFERDSARSWTLKKMVRAAGAEKLVKMFEKTDFLRVDPDDATFSNVRAILLDPSCSGSGIIGRDDDAELSLPDDLRSYHQQQKQPGRKRKRSLGPTETEGESHQDSKALFARLESLAAFQLKLLLRAMRFPKAVMISYSTCSIHSEENESVVIQALSSRIAKERGWKILKRDDQFEGLKRWKIRGDLEACRSITQGLMIDDSEMEFKPEDIADACIRCEKGTKDGTMGFFVAGFIRCYETKELQEQSRRRREEARNQDIEYFKLRATKEVLHNPAGEDSVLD